jgi:hypothetical protein
MRSVHPKCGGAAITPPTPADIAKRGKTRVSRGGRKKTTPTLPFSWIKAHAGHRP